MFVIPLILTEDAARLLTDEQLAMLADCSTEVIRDKVMDYCDDPNADAQVRQKVFTVYKAKLDMQEYLESEDTKVKAELVNGLDYGDISLMMDLGNMVACREAIKAILDNKFSIPYVPPIQGDLIKTLREDIAAQGKEMKNPDLIAFGKNLKKFSAWFRDPPHSAYKGTVVKRIVRNKSKYEIILRGLDFLIDKKSRGVQPSEWRYL